MFNMKVLLTTVTGHHGHPTSYLALEVHVLYETKSKMSITFSKR